MNIVNSLSGFRELLPEELNNVSGSGSTYVYVNGTTVVTEYYDNNGDFTGAEYSRSDGSGSWFSINGDSGSWSSSSNSLGSPYASAGFGYGGAVGGISYVFGGDTYGYLGVGLPGPSATVGADLDGDLSGLGINAPSPSGLTSLVIDPVTGQVTAVEAGRTSASITYTFNLSEFQQDVTGTLQNYIDTFTSGFIENYYPEQLWNPDYQQQQPPQ